MPSEITEGGSILAVVAHHSGCTLLIERTRQRWPLRPAALPDTPGQTPFGRYAGYAPTVAAWQRARSSIGAHPSESR